MIKAIVAVDSEWGIGKNNDLLFSIPEDMKFFRQTTLNGVVCMGYNTLLSFPNSKPLKNRTNIVLCPTGTIIEGAITVNSLEQLFLELKNYTQDIFVIGGAMFYKTMLNYCDEILVTKVDACGGATVFYDNLDNNSNFTLSYTSEKFNSNGYNFTFNTYKNLNVEKF